MASDGSVIINTELDDSGFRAGLSKLGSIASGALKGGVAVIGGVTAAAGGAVASLLALEEATEEYRVAQGKLNSAFIAAGSDADMAAYAYSEFYKILGDTDTATEASQLMAQLSTDGEDIAYWTHIAAGAYASFGDALPVEGLIEAANETVKVGEVTGTLADALNWVGLSEDAVNEKLAEFSTEAERSEYLMNLLMDAYDEAAHTFEEGNASLIAAREAQIQMDNALAELGTAVSDVKTRMTAEFLPAISEVTAGLAGMLSGTEGAEEQFSQGIQSIIDTAVEKLPEFLTFGTQILTAVLNGIIRNIPAVLDAVPQVVDAIISAFVDMYPNLLESGQAILTQITDGIIEYVPKMIAALPDVIVAILNFLTGNLPSILQKGSELLEQLAFGILEAIPVLVSKLPQVIAAITNFLVTNFPVLVKMGAELIGQLIVGILGTVPQIAANMPKIIGEIINALMAALSEMRNVGSYLMEGLWNGISDKISWLKSKVSGVVNTIKGWFTGKDGFDTHSPSKWSEKIGGYVDDGLAVGVDKGKPEVQRAISGMMDIVKAIPSASIGVQSANVSMAPVSSNSGVVYNAPNPTGGVDASVLSELRAIRDAVLEGKVIMVDKKVLGKVASDANRANMRMTGVVTY